MVTRKLLLLLFCQRYVNVGSLFLCLFCLDDIIDLQSGSSSVNAIITYAFVLIKD